MAIRHWILSFAPGMVPLGYFLLSILFSGNTLSFKQWLLLAILIPTSGAFVYWFERKWGYLRSEIDKIAEQDLPWYGEHYMLDKDDDNCFLVYDRMLKIHKNDKNLYCNILYTYGMACYYFGGYHTKAIKLYKELLLLWTDIEKIMNVNLLLAIFYGELGDLQNALKYIEANITSDGDDCSYNTWISSICFKSYFQIENNIIDTSFCSVYDKLGTTIQNFIKNGKTEEIADYFIEIIFYIYWIWKVQNNSKLSHQILQYLINNYQTQYIQTRYLLSPNQLFQVQLIYYIIAQFYHYCDDALIQNDKLALEYYSKLLEKRPFFAFGYYDEAVLLYKRKEYELALGSLEKAYQINPNIPVIKQCYYKMKQALLNEMR